MSRHQSASSDLLKSGLFDPDWYSSTYPDVRMSGLSPAEHFLRIGKRLGRHGTAEAQSVHRFFPPVETAAANDAKPDRHPVQGSVPQRLIPIIRESRLFDERWYAERYAPLIRNPRDLLEDYFHAFEADPQRDPGPLFSTTQYLEWNPDVRGIHPFLHFIEYGLAEGRAAFSAANVNRFFATADHGKIAPISDLVRPDQPTLVLSWKDGNFFFAEIAEYAAQYLESLGFSAQHRHEASIDDIERCNVIIVAPHEFCVYGPGKGWSDEILGRAVYLNTEQWQTTWFSLTYGFALRSGKMLDINPSSAAAFAQLGFTCGFVPLLPLSGSCFAHDNRAPSATLVRTKALKNLTYPENFQERPYDLLFIGVLNKRRGQALASLAPCLQAHDCFLHCPEFDGPVRPQDPDMIGSGDLAQIARNSKILLNIHQGDAAYFEWHRLFLSGILEGCVVLTEPCVPTGIVSPNEHFIEASHDEMPSIIARLLETKDGLKEMERIHQNCRRLRAAIDSGQKTFQ